MGGGASKSKSSQVAPAEENGAEKYKADAESAPDDLDNTAEYFFHNISINCHVFESFSLSLRHVSTNIFISYKILKQNPTPHSGTGRRHGGGRHVIV